MKYGRLALVLALGGAGCGRAAYTQLDAAAPLLGDASADAAADANLDAGPTSSTARPIAPWSGATATSRQPSFRFVLGGGADAGRVEVCRDPGCTDLVASLDGPSPARLPALLANTQLDYFWRVTPLAGGAVSGPSSAVWPFRARYASDPAAADACFGARLDVDADGHPELAASAPDVGEVWIVAGSATGPAATPRWTLRGPPGLGTSLASAGDLDGDGLGELLVGSPGEDLALVVRPRADGALEVVRLVGAAGSRFGEVVSGGGDLDADGFADLAVAAPGEERVYVFRGGPGGPSTTASLVLPAPTSGTRFGAALGAGDFDGDGFGDLAIGAPDGARVHVHFGSAAGLASAPRVTLAGADASLFGASLSANGDLSFDGRSDLVVGAPAAGEAHAFLGAAGGLDATATVLAQPVSAFGAMVAGIVDVDLNGYDDVAISNGDGSLWLYLGNPRGLGSARGWIQETALPAGALGFGAAVGDAGDVDGDRYGDTLVGAPQSASFYFFPGTGGGLGRTPALWTGRSGSRLGAALAHP